MQVRRINWSENHWSWILFTFTIINFWCGTKCEDESIASLRGHSVVLTCPVDVTSCGDLHSVKWFKGSDRIAVVSGDGEVVNIQSAFKSRMSIDHSPNGPATRLHIKAAQVTDEDTYVCESTFLEPLESCNNLGAYSIDFKVLVPPSAILVLDEEGNQLKNSTTLGPLREGHTLGGTCEVRGARPAPVVGWYRSGKRLTDTVTIDESNGLFLVKSTLSLVLSRQELASIIECRVETPALEHIVSNQLVLDLQVRPTKINLSGVKHHTVQGTKVLLQCHVFGARPAANVTWYNSTRALSTDHEPLSTISTKTYLQNDGTFETVSQLIFTATRYENGAAIRCEGDNIVMRDDLEKPIHETLVLEVMYPPVVTVRPENITINETEEFLLLCEYDANPASLESVRWKLNGNVIWTGQSDRFEGGHAEQTALLVKNASRTDSGLYTCELSNAIGNDTSDNEINVVVQYVPTVELDMDPESPIVENRASNVTLYCNVVKGNPTQLLKVRWFLDGQLLKELPECVPDETNGEDEDLCEIDPSKMLLQNVGRDFLGNYSCEGLNAAGWGPRSREEELVVYYEPGNASIHHHPPIPIKRKSVTLSCTVDDGGNPNATRYRWLRGHKSVMDVVTPMWTVDPVGLDSRTNFSCYAYNEGGEGNPATVQLDVHAPPAFIQKLPPYTGALYATQNISLACRVECIPRCNISWFKDGVGIEEFNERYEVSNKYMEADPSTGDFESTSSTLHFNMSAWPDEKLDIFRDSANYSCVSSNNSVGVGVRSATYFGVEYPPENTTVSNAEISVEEGHQPQRILCSAKAYPEPTYEWRRLGQVIAKGNALIVNKAMLRLDSGPYTCISFNRHGNHSAETIMNVLYRPNCSIVRREIEDEDTLVCTAHGNPEAVDFHWALKTENDSIDAYNVRQDGIASYLILEDGVSVTRTYRCVANNSVGFGTTCEIDVPEVKEKRHIVWWQRWDRMTLIILIASVFALLLAVIIVCIIIICICRKRRRQDKFVTYRKAPLSVNQPERREATEGGDSLPSTDSRKRKKGSVSDHDKSSAAGDPLTLTEPGEYENLPFHGLQSAPNKSTHLNANSTTTHLTSNVVRVAPRPKNPSTLNSCLHSTTYPTFTTNMYPGNSGYPNNFTVNTLNYPTYPSMANSASLNPFLAKRDRCQGHVEQQRRPEKKFSSLKSLGLRKSPQFYSMRVSKSCKRHNSFAGDIKKPSPQPPYNNVHREKYEQQPLYENLTDSIQIHESSLQNESSFASVLMNDDYGANCEGERTSIYRSDSGISNSSYECITPVPAPRTGQRTCQSAPIYMNLPSMHPHSSRNHHPATAFANYERTPPTNPFTGNQRRQILVPKELFPATGRKSSSRRLIKLPLRKHHSFHFQPTQPVNESQRTRDAYKHGGPLVFKPLSEKNAFKPITPVPKSPGTPPPRICGTSLKRHVSNVEVHNEEHRMCNGDVKKRLHYADLAPLPTKYGKSGSSSTGSSESATNGDSEESIKLMNLVEKCPVNGKRTQYATLKFNEVNI
ncbi:hemicentin-2 isoform X5 [Phlebotomus papatasi]|uniref:hemicentin-2 isoform X5 n=1 Tax=Phlebotomus papatasi TaxID=29031 RepID=UPI0024838EDD|nr:hemicentin-2 isoform X5 [Phlebotomus papatasi]